MGKSISYRYTMIACYLGNIIHASVINLTPILFIPLKEQFGFSYSQLGLLILVNFITQVLVDILFSKAVDQYGFRRFIVAGNIVCVFGFMLFALTPYLFVQHEFTGFMIATIIFSGAGGLFELLLSPIVDAIPSEEASKPMALLHSFYAWGQIAVVLITTLSVFLKINFTIIVFFWMLLPIMNTFLFLKVPLAVKHHGVIKMRIRKMIANPIFIIAFFAIAFGAASELVMGQWMSSFMEKGLLIPKLTGDMIALCGFAFMLGLGRLIYGVFGDRFDINKVLIYGSMITVFCYLIVALSPYDWLSVTACILSGICVSLLWPGTLVVASGKLPLAGAALFALLAAGGDIGASVGPWLTGVVTDFSMRFIPESLSISGEQFGLRMGILLAALYPLFSMIFHISLRNKSKASIQN